MGAEMCIRDRLWDTTLDPNVRTLLRVRIEHGDQAEDVFSTLMGDVVEPRRDFIQDNALKVVNLDVLNSSDGPRWYRSTPRRRHR